MPLKGAGLQEVEELTEFCPGCGKELPLSEFLAGQEQVAISNPAPVCRECQANGIRGFEPPAARDLSMRQRTVLKALMIGMSYADAARAARCSENYVRKLIKGYGPYGGEAFRAVFNQMLESEGLDYYSIVRMARLLFYAVRPQWNPKTEEFEFFPDNQTRLGMLRQLTKLRELDPPNVNQVVPSAPVVNIYTNVGKNAQPRTAPGTWDIEDGQIIAAPEIEERAGNARSG